jgi:hypothetical protein
MNAYSIFAIDAPALFGPVIMSLSLLSDCIMTFTSDNQHVDIVLRKAPPSYCCYHRH